jgi:hypothetical protein
MLGILNFGCFETGCFSFGCVGAKLQNWAIWRWVVLKVGIMNVGCFETGIFGVLTPAKLNFGLFETGYIGVHSRFWPHGRGLTRTDISFFISFFLYYFLFLSYLTLPILPVLTIIFKINFVLNHQVYCFFLFVVIWVENSFEKVYMLSFS